MASCSGTRTTPSRDGLISTRRSTMRRPCSNSLPHLEHTLAAFFLAFIRGGRLVPREHLARVGGRIRRLERVTNDGLIVRENGSAWQNSAEKSVKNPCSKIVKEKLTPEERMSNTYTHGTRAPAKPHRSCARRVRGPRAAAAQGGGADAHRGASRRFTDDRARQIHRFRSSSATDCNIISLARMRPRISPPFWW